MSEMLKLINEKSLKHGRIGTSTNQFLARFIDSPSNKMLPNVDAFRADALPVTVNRAFLLWSYSYAISWNFQSQVVVVWYRIPVKKNIYYKLP